MSFRTASPFEMYAIIWRAFRAMPVIHRNTKSNLVSQAFQERLMLAVTEVNGCAICSYEHAKLALEAGLSKDEIEGILAGLGDSIPETEKPAILFAQYYAEQKGAVARASWQKLQDTYGKDTADVIACIIQGIMLGNTGGVLAGTLTKFKEKNGPQVSRGYAIGMLILMILYLPFCLVTALIASLLHTSRVHLV